MYIGRYQKQTPIGYSGTAFAKAESEDRPQAKVEAKAEVEAEMPLAEEEKKIAPAPAKGGAGEESVRESAKEEPKEVPKYRLPCDFAAAKSMARESEKPKREEEKEKKNLLYELLQGEFSLEDLLFMGAALLLLTKDEAEGDMPLLALLLLLLGR